MGEMFGRGVAKGVGRGDVEKGWVRIVNRYIYIYIYEYMYSIEESNFPKGKGGR